MKKIMFTICCTLLLSACSTQEQPADETIADETEIVEEAAESIEPSIVEVVEVEEPEYIPEHKTREELEYSDEKAMWIIVDSFDAYVTDICIDDNPGMLETGWDEFMSAGMSDVMVEPYVNTLEHIAESKGIAIDSLMSKYGSFSEVMQTGTIFINILSSGLDNLVEDTNVLDDATLAYNNLTSADVTALNDLNKAVQAGTVDLNEIFSPTDHYIDIAYSGSIETINEMVELLSTTADKLSIDYTIEVNIRDYDNNLVLSSVLYPCNYVLDIAQSQKYTNYIQDWNDSLQLASHEVHEKINAKIIKTLNDEESFKYIDCTVLTVATAEGKNNTDEVASSSISDDGYVGPIPYTDSIIELNDAIIFTEFSAKNSFNATMKASAISIVSHRTGDVTLLIIE